MNDGGAEYADRKESQQVFLDFVEEPADSLRRSQEGIYASYNLGEAFVAALARYHDTTPTKYLTAVIRK
jgi:alkaline phosphatase D